MILVRMAQTASTAPRWDRVAAQALASIASNANGFVFGNQVTGSPYTTGAPMNAGTGTPCDYPISGGTGTCGSSTNQLGRIDIAVAPSNPNYIYAQAQSIVWNNNGRLWQHQRLPARRLGFHRWWRDLELYGGLARRLA